ncbi:hypothetical protein EH153_03520 [Elizabethkingia anophelis]|uniref:TauD/TfdA family dioxygenase n=1 Tax=Elizabethkingia anophelis TaxID=1117645 RepID=UPI001367F5A8|nr:TauD/TfdA family dioxygenase [Elizabethkingia anophelis]MYY47045.1 hypothetical protein [Elizabethkingia anophelis]
MKWEHESLHQLNSKGWIEFSSSTDDDILVDLSKKIGEIIVHPNGNYIDYLKPKNKEEATKNTFSYNFELDKFPFHTDTAFWELPARFVLLSCENKSDTGTTFVTFNDIYKDLTSLEISELRKSIFLIKTTTKNFYTSFLNKHLNQEFIRFDSNCMKPVNKSAKTTLEIIDEKLNKLAINKITWDKPKVFVFDNWKILHGRESVKNNENRILKRIYIK